MEEIRIQMSPKGPYLIKERRVVVVDAEGNEHVKEGSVALCRCALSKNKPFCDGSHRGCEHL
jgi:CDGSH-type Zn-finger protein